MRRHCCPSRNSAEIAAHGDSSLSLAPYSNFNEFMPPQQGNILTPRFPISTSTGQQEWGAERGLGGLPEAERSSGRRVCPMLLCFRARPG